MFPIILDAQQEYSINDLTNGNNRTDSSYIYTLPFEVKKKVLLIQGYESMFSHKGERALDFKVKKGTKICAASSGIVTATRKDSDSGGIKPENISDENFVELPTRFYTQDAVLYLRHGKFFKRSD